MPAQKKQLSLDANIVFDLAGDKDFAFICIPRGLPLLFSP